nr:immunoglobulin heavy chain junction region [Mus musculus]MBK4186187.1 immunoglobulin heavy chain junction region [Mus musculus]
CARGYVNFDYW